MRIKRKAQDNAFWILGTMVLVVFTVWFVLNWLTGTTADAATSLGSINLGNRHQLCELNGKKIIERGLEPKEEIEFKIEFKQGIKGDGFPDDCDLCLGGDDSIVTNSYGIPDSCYSDPIKNKKIKTYKDMCKARGGCYISDTDQCCLLTKDVCGEKCK